MENLKNNIELTGNPVMFSGLSIPQEDVYKNHNLYKQSMSHSELIKTYENEFKTFVNANKKQELRCQSWFEKEMDQSLSMMQNSTENSDMSTCYSTHLNKSNSFKHNPMEWNRICGTFQDHPLWKMTGEDTHRLLSSCKSHSTPMNVSNLTEDAYLCKVDPSKLLLTDVDYLRAKCRWHNKHVSDYAFNSKVIERMRYLDMFTQCYAVRNDENEYNNLDADEDGSCYFVERDNLDVYPKQKCITYEPRAFDNFQNIPERENSSAAVEENLNVGTGSTYKKHIISFSVPNVKVSSANIFSHDVPVKRLRNPTINAESDKNNGQFKVLISPTMSSRKSIFNTNCDKNDKICPRCNCCVPNKKSKNRFTACSCIIKNSGCKHLVESGNKHLEGFTANVETKEHAVENLKNYQQTGYPSGESRYKENLFKENDIKHVPMESKGHSEYILVKDVETQYQNPDYELTGDLQRNENQKNADDDLSTIFFTHKNKNNNTSQNSFTNTETLSSNENYKQVQNFDLSRSSVNSGQLPEDLNHTILDVHIVKNVGTVTSNRVMLDGEKAEDRKPSFIHYNREKRSNENILVINKRDRDYDKITDEYETNSENSEVIISSTEFESDECTELINKHFLHEFIVSALQSGVKESEVKSTSVDKTKEITATKIESGNSESAEDNDGDNGMVTNQSGCKECENKQNVKNVNKECSCNNNKGHKPIIVIDFYGEKNSKMEDEIDHARKTDSHHHHCFSNEHLCYIRGYTDNENFVPVSGTSFNSSLGSKLTTIQEASESCSEKPCEISLKIIGTTDSLTKADQKRDTKKSGSELKNSKLEATDEFDKDSEVYDNYLTHRNSASSVNVSSESLLSVSVAKNKKIKKRKRKKIKKRQFGDGHKNIESSVKAARRDKRKQKTNNSDGKENVKDRKNAGQNVYISCWKRYCVIL